MLVPPRPQRKQLKLNLIDAPSAAMGQPRGQQAAALSSHLKKESRKPSHVVEFSAFSASESIAECEEQKYEAPEIEDSKVDHKPEQVDFSFR